MNSVSRSGCTLRISPFRSPAPAWQKTGTHWHRFATIGFYGSYALTPRWLLSGRVDFFSLNYNDYDGSLTAYRPESITGLPGTSASGWVTATWITT